MLAFLVLKSNYSKTSQLYGKVMKAYDMAAKSESFCAHPAIYI